MSRTEALKLCQRLDDIRTHLDLASMTYLEFEEYLDVLEKTMRYLMSTCDE